MTTDERPLSEAMVLIAKYIDARGETPIKDTVWHGTLPGTPPIDLWVNGYGTPQTIEHGYLLQPFHAYAEMGGLPVADMYPFGGVAAWDGEDVLIARLQAALR